MNWVQFHKTSTRNTFFSLISWSIGILCALSFNILKDFGLNFFDFLDKMTSSVLMPLGGVLTVAFFGWIIKAEKIHESLGGKSLFSLAILWSSRTIAPIGVTVVLILGLKDWLGLG